MKSSKSLSLFPGTIGLDSRLPLSLDSKLLGPSCLHACKVCLDELRKHPDRCHLRLIGADQRETSLHRTEETRSSSWATWIRVLASLRISNNRLQLDRLQFACLTFGAGRVESCVSRLAESGACVGVWHVISSCIRLVQWSLLFTLLFGAFFYAPSLTSSGEAESLIGQLMPLERQNDESSPGYMSKTDWRAGEIGLVSWPVSRFTLFAFLPFSLGTQTTKIHREE